MPLFLIIYVIHNYSVSELNPIIFYFLFFNSRLDLSDDAHRAKLKLQAVSYF